MEKKNKDVMITVRAEKFIVDSLDKKAKKEKMSRSRLILKACREYLAR